MLFLSRFASSSIKLFSWFNSLELVYQLLLKIKQGNIPQKLTLTNWLLENMQGLGNLNLPDRNETDRVIPFQP